LIALEIIKECLQSSSISNPVVQFCFIELNHADSLGQNISGYPNAEVIPGKFEDNIKAMLQGKEGHNIFLYIDPYGIKAINCGLFDELSNCGFNSIEMLINLNSFGFLREACRVLGASYEDVESFDEIVEYDPTIMETSEKSAEELTQIAGGDYWKEIVEDYKSGKINGYQAEFEFSRQFYTRLNQSYKYVLNMPIRLREGQHPKYRLIHVTNHQDGCCLMVENMCKRREVLQKIQTCGQMKIFDETVDNQLIHHEEILKLFEAHLSKYTDETLLNIIIADFYTQNGLVCDYKMLIDIIKNLEAAEKISIRRDPPFRKNGTPTRFYSQNRNKTIFVRYGK